MDLILKENELPGFLDAAKQAATEIFLDRNIAFEEITNRPWYKSLLNAVTFQQGDKRRIVQNVHSLANLQALLIETYTHQLKSQDSELDNLMQQIIDTQQVAHKLYISCILQINPQENIGNLCEEDQQILLLFLGEFNRTDALDSEAHEQLQKYNRGVASSLYVSRPDGNLQLEQLEKVQSPEVFYRCVLEQCAVTGNLEPLHMPGNISEAVRWLDISDKKKVNLLSTVNAELKDFGIPFFFEKYKKPQPIIHESDFDFVEEVDSTDKINPVESTDTIEEKKISSNSTQISGVIDILALNQEQHEWMLNLKMLKVEADMAMESDAQKKGIKHRWLYNWKEIESSEFKKTFSAECNFYGYTQDKMKECAEKLLQSENSKLWYYLAVMEAELFEPYYPLGTKEENKKFKELKFRRKTFIKEFVQTSGQIEPSFIGRVNKTYQAAIARMEGRYGKIAVGALSAVAIAAITAATAGVMAGPIAVALVGGNFTFGGAALTSASLALLGGGSIAAGGAGMAGGVATIVGGGALLGMAVGGTASAAVTGLLLATPEMTLKMAAKLEVTIREILLNAQHDVPGAYQILSNYKEELKRLKYIVVELEEKDTKDKAQIKSLNKSIKYITTSIDSLDKFVSSYEIGQAAVKS